MTTATLNKLSLTTKQESFAIYLFQGLSQRDAYLKAGYSSHQLPNTIDRAASAIANSYKVATRLKELQAQAESAAVMTVMERKTRLSEVGRANLTDFVDSDGNITLKPSAALAELVVEDWRGNGEDKRESRTKRLKVRDPITAIAELNKMERIGADSTPQVNVNVQFVIGKGYREMPLIEGGNGNSDQT